MASPATANHGEMVKVLNQIIGCLKVEMDVKGLDGKPKFADCCEWLASKLDSEESRKAHADALMELLDSVKSIVSAEEQMVFQDLVPPVAACHVEQNGVLHLEKFPLRLWQLGIQENSHVKGAPALHGPVRRFSVGVSIGSSVTMACHLCAWAVLKLGLLDELAADVKKELAKRLIGVLCLYGTCDAKENAEAQTMESLRVKTDASARSRPSVYNIHFMLDKVVCHKQKMGSRKARQDLFQESVTKHNRTAVGKAKLNTQEVQALYFYDQAPATIQRMLKLIWGTQNPSQTAVPLTLVGRDFLLPKKSMSSKFPADTNPLWHEISKHTWDKVEEFFKRLETKWNFKLQEYYNRGQNPPINNAQICGPFRDSGKEAEVFMMASFVNHFEKDLKHEMGDQEFLKFQTSWRQGTLDKRLMPEVTAARVDFRLSDLGLSGQDADMSGEVKLPDCFDCDDEEKEKLQDLISLARSLKKEQDTMRSYKANLARHQTASLAAESEYQAAVSNSVDAAWKDHELWYSVQACKNITAVQAAGSAILQGLAARQLTDIVNLAVIGVLNVPMLGMAASSHLRMAVGHVASELASKAGTCIYVIVPPNQPEYGAGSKSGKRNWHENVAAHCELWKTELEAANVKLLTCTALYDESTMYSDERALGFQFWIAVAASVMENLPKQNVFGSSTLIKRKAIPGLVSCLHRADMANFWKDLSFSGSGSTNRDLDAERRQFFSGAALYCQLLKTLFQGTKLKVSNMVFIKDETCYDSELAKAVGQMNAMKVGNGMKTWPNLAYCVLAWACNTGVKETIAKNVKDAIEGYVKGAMSRGEYALVTIPLQPKPGQKSQAPPLDESTFALTVPAANQELHWLKSTLDKGKRCGNMVLPSSEPWQNMTWPDLVAVHNKEFNPREASRNKRTAEEPVEELHRQNVGAVHALKPDSHPALDEMGRCKSPLNTHEWYVDKAGNLYCKAVTDCTLSGALFPVHGHFKTGPEAAALMEEANAGLCIPYRLTEESMVLLKSKQNLPESLQSFSTIPGSLKEILSGITQASLPNPGLHLHKILDGKVTCLEHAVLKPTIMEAEGGGDESGQFPPAEISASKLSQYVDLSKLARAEVVCVLEYDQGTNKLKGMLPQVCAKDMFKISKDTVVKM
ncbi:unnamed protein product [Cladocopium goreaui]|uniref:Uncharacterized protein n=1 Tax=Cladocopium goreaui TaxID=2562237 RepID=A0A9P1C9G8_9DINO|nr:unnamed protein product [Cladocopium goreaui]